MKDGPSLVASERALFYAKYAEVEAVSSEGLSWAGRVYDGVSQNAFRRRDLWAGEGITTRATRTLAGT
jgi:hypothetical protein